MTVNIVRTHGETGQNVNKTIWLYITQVLQRKLESYTEMMLFCDKVTL